MKPILVNSEMTSKKYIQSNLSQWVLSPQTRKTVNRFSRDSVISLKQLLKKIKEETFPLINFA